MTLPKYDPKDKVSQRIFYLELKKQIDEIDSIENKIEKKRMLSKLKLDLYNAICRKNITSLKETKKKKTYILSIFVWVKQVIINLINRLKGFCNE